MKVKKVLLILLVCALALLVFPAATNAKSHDRPFKVSLSGEVIFVPGDVVDLPPSPSPTGLYTVSSAVGNASHLGLTEAFSYHPTPTGTDIAGGHMVLTAANDDKVFIEYEGYAPYPVIGIPSTIPVNGHFTITGGTGRFHDASGTGTFDAAVEFPGVLSPGPWPATWYWTGTISY